jgi:hypothetical protein
MYKQCKNKNLFSGWLYYTESTVSFGTLTSLQDYKYSQRYLHQRYKNHRI